ncbi:hypothetical protein ACFSRY_20485 [Pontibacter locisalis]|uniref:DUF2490 domain-containing protein n=1 Tax=Pontibacter locisalis TaxID=1719035 RepID=A0ABW5IT35_9BACT
MKKLCLLLLLSLPLTTFAQSKVTAPVAIWPELQLSYGVKDDGLLFFRNQYRVNTDSRFNDLRTTGLLSNFERVELSLGYEHKLTEHWRGGGLVHYAAEDFPKMIFYALFLRHNGKLSSLYLNKQLMFEYIDQEKQDIYGRFRLTAELGRRFPVGSKFLTPEISYEAALLSDFGKEDNNASQERLIDRTQLKVELNFEVTEKLRISPYFMRHTEYYYVEVPSVYDEQNQLEQEGYRTKRNRVSPVIGLELRYSFNRAANTASITY